MDLKSFRQQLEEDTLEYFHLSEEEKKKFGTGYYMNLDAETPLPSDEPEEIWDQLYTKGARTDLLNNCEFNIWRDSLYDLLLFRAGRGVQSAFVHGAGIGHEAFILQSLGIATYYYEPDENKKEFMKWRYKKHFSERFCPVDTTHWKRKELANLEVDLVVSFDVLEHLHAPFRTISRLGDMLDSHGQFVVMPAFQYPKHKQHLSQHNWITGHYFVKVMEGLGFEVTWRQGNFYSFSPIFNTHDVWKL